jgi:hypothetical protein
MTKQELENWLKDIWEHTIFYATTSEKMSIDEAELMMIMRIGQAVASLLSDEKDDKSD